MCDEGCSGLVVVILCDGGECYAYSYYDLDWYVCNGIDMEGVDR